MSFFGVRFTTKEEREKMNLPWGRWRDFFRELKKEKKWQLTDSNSLFDVTDFDELESIEKMILEFQHLSRSDFYFKNSNELGINRYWNQDEFEKVDERQALNILILRKLDKLGVFFRLLRGVEIKADQLLSFVNQRIHEFYNESFWLDEESILSCAFRERRMTRTKFLEYMLEEIDCQLSIQGLRLVIFEVTDEEEYIGVFSENIYQKYFETEGGREKAYRIRKEE